MIRYHLHFYFTLFICLMTVSVCLGEKYVRTPGGLVWSSCVHHVKHGAQLIVTKDRKVTVIEGDKFRTIPRCPKSTIFSRPKALNNNVQELSQNLYSTPDDGWQVWTAFNNNNNATFTSFLSYFTVPPEPHNWSGGVMYIFPGLQNDNWVPVVGGNAAPPGYDIIQPVLQYGRASLNGGGSYWGISSWYISLDAGAFYSDEILVNQGDNIYGNMTKTDESTWFIGSVNPWGIETSLTVTKDDLVSQSWAYCALEAYNVDDCSQFPPYGSTSEFTRMILTGEVGETLQPVWSAQSNNGNHCQTKVKPHTPDHVTITF